MNQPRALAGLLAVLACACALVAWEWYVHLGTARRSAPPPVQQIAAAASGAPTPSPVPTQTPVTYVIVPQTAAPATPATAPAAAPQTSVQPGAIPATSAPSPAPTATPYTADGERAIDSAPQVRATIVSGALNVQTIRAPSNAPPQILSLTLSSPVVRGGELVSGSVQTSSNVASVEARIAGYSAPLTKVGVGRFELHYRVPRLPFFLHRTYLIEVVARNTAGVAVRTAIPITVH